MSAHIHPATAPDGLYWYLVPGEAPEPVLIERARYGDRFKAFNGREQSWLRDGERLVGPVEPPLGQDHQVGEDAAALREADPSKRAQLDDVRAKIAVMRKSDAFVQHVLALADVEHLSEADRYAMLALRALWKLGVTQRALDDVVARVDQSPRLLVQGAAPASPGSAEQPDIGAEQVAVMRMQAVALAFQWFTANNYQARLGPVAHFNLRPSDFGFSEKALPGLRIKVQLTVEHDT